MSCRNKIVLCVMMAVACWFPPILQPATATGEIGQDSRFTGYSEGMVLDTKSKLMCAVADNGKDVNWTEAALFCEEYAGGGFDDWRLPTSEELATLYTPGKANKDGLFVTELIRLSSIMLWTSDRQTCKAKCMDFTTGLMMPIVGSRPDIARALPVRSVTKNPSNGIGSQ